MNLRDSNTSQTSVILILNASPNSDLLNSRAKMLNDAGYYTSSAGTPEEAVLLAAAMHFAVALICHSFAIDESRALSERLRKLSPSTAIVCLQPELDNQQGILVSRVEQALARLIA